MNPLFHPNHSTLPRLWPDEIPDKLAHCIVFLGGLIEELDRGGGFAVANKTVHPLLTNTA